MDTNVHDDVQSLWVELLKASGFSDIRTEDRSYDANATASDVDHRRPDIVASQPEGCDDTSYYVITLSIIESLHNVLGCC